MHDHRLSTTAPTAPERMAKPLSLNQIELPPASMLFTFCLSPTNGAMKRALISGGATS